MLILITLVLIVGLAGIIGNQYAGLRRIELLQEFVAELNRKLEKISRKVE